jgi:hypothetical protein
MRSLTVYFLLFTLFQGAVLYAQQGEFWHGIPRELRYKPDGNNFVIVNGNNKFNRALYGSHTAFRIETSDMPEFGFFMPHNGGNLQLAVLKNKKSLWLNDAEYIQSVYNAGSRIYVIKDPFLDGGRLKITVLAMSNADGMIMKIEGIDLPESINLFALFGGANNKRFSRNGDLGVDPPNIFDLKPEACENNDYTIHANRFTLIYGQNTRTTRSTMGIFPENAELKIASSEFLDSPNKLWNSESNDNKPVIVAKFLMDTKHKFLAIKKNEESNLKSNDLAKLFDEAEVQRQKVAGTVKIETPDPYISPLGSVLSVAADAIWDDCWVHGAIGWRIPLNGWRAAYTGDAVGWHGLTRKHFDGYAASQIKHIEPVIPHPAPDSSLNLARALKKWGTPMYSKGYICRRPNDTSQMHHYDMNLSYIDELLWHFNWTGDMDYVRKMWPVIERHLAWEKLNFDPDNDGLYNAYASIWASDALYYNSGGVTHSSSFNYRANKMAAEIADKIGEDPAPYKQEAEKILQAINQELWLAEKGWWAEFKDFMGKKIIHPDAAIWTVYHALDSDVGTPFQAYQATRYIDTKIPKIPVKGSGLDSEDYYTISTTNWLPYAWSINNVAFAEIAHTCLAYWQAGRNDEAFHLFKGAVLDGMYMGNSPGNIGQISFYDAARGECYRDFGDPVGMYSRALIQGLFGILPDLMNNKLVIRPGFPSDWDKASISTLDLDFNFIYTDNESRYKINNRISDKAGIELHIKALKDGIKQITVNGKKKKWSFEKSVGQPLIKIICEPAENLDIIVSWNGEELQKPGNNLKGIKGEMLKLVTENEILKVYDPQKVLANLKSEKNSITGELIGETGMRTLFVQLKQQQMTWWEPISVEIREPFTIICDTSKNYLEIVIRNNSGKALKADLLINPNCVKYSLPVQLDPFSQSGSIKIPSDASVLGTNCIQVNEDGKVLFKENVINWNIENVTDNYQPVEMAEFWNASVSDIFEQEYLSPRSPYTTLQIPKQGIGEWCHPKHTAEINDSGFRASVKDGLFVTPFQMRFKSVSDRDAKNIAFVSLWDNYPNEMTIPLSGKASHIYFLMAGSTNHMQCHITNGRIIVEYSDGSKEELKLINPDNWLPIEQDLFIDGYAFNTDVPRPYRVALKNGAVSRNLEKVMGINPNEVYGRKIDGGAATIIDLPVHKDKELKSLRIIADANEVIIGLMGICLYK